MASADLVVASELTLIESHRVLHRAVAANELSESATSKRLSVLERASQHWLLFRLESEVIQRCLEPFPAEPIRTLDAIHLATALLVRGLLPELTVLTLDRRVRVSAVELGLDVLP